MRHDDLDERLRKLGVNVGPFTFTVVFLIGVAACDRNWLAPVLAVALPVVEIVHF